MSKGTKGASGSDESHQQNTVTKYNYEPAVANKTFNNLERRE